MAIVRFFCLIIFIGFMTAYYVALKRAGEMYGVIGILLLAAVIIGALAFSLRLLQRSDHSWRA